MDLKFSGCKNILERCLVVFSLLSFWLFLATIPPLRIGIWGDAELLNCLMHFISSILFFCGAFFCYCRSSFVSHSQIVLLIPLLSFVLFSVILWPFYQNHYLHFYGLPQTVEGVLFYLSFLVFFVGFSVLINSEKGKILAYNAIIASLAITILTFASHPDKLSFYSDWCPYVFSAFLGPIAIMLPSYGFVFENVKIRKVLLALSFVIIALSSNKTALCASVLYGVIILALKKLEISRRTYAFFIGCIPVLILGFEFILIRIGTFGSIDSRIKLLQIVFEHFKESPFSLLTGWGWGHYTEALMAQASKLPIAFYQEEIFSPTWDSFERVDFHCHHQGLESLLALGVTGFILAIVLPAIPVLMCKKENLSLTVYICALWTTISSTWFTLGIHLPFLALGLALMVENSRFRFPQFSMVGIKVLNRRFLSICFFSVGCVLILATYHEWQRAKTYTSRNNRWLACEVDNQSLNENQLLTHGGLNGIHLAKYLQKSLDHVREFPDDAYGKDELFLLTKVALRLSRPNLYLCSILSNVLDYLSCTNQLNKNSEKEWKELVYFILKVFPSRSDLVASFLTHSLFKGTFVDVNEIIDVLLERDFNNSIAIWFKGLSLSQQEDNNGEGIFYLRQALERGVDRWIPIPMHFKKQLEKS